MHRSSIVLAVAAATALLAAACGGDSESSYEASRPASDGPVRTIATGTEAPETTTGGTIVLPTFPGSSTPDTTEPDTPSSSIPASGEVVVTESWFADDGYGGYDWGIVFENTSSTPFEYVPVQAVFLDASGAELATSEATINLALPGVGATYDFTYDLDEAPASMEVTIGDADEGTFDQTGTITVGSLAVDESTSNAVGLLTSTYGADLLDVIVTGVWRDGSGAIVKMTEDYLDAVQANGDSWFSLSLSDTALGAPTEVYWGTSPTWYEPSPPSAEVALQESWMVADGQGGQNWGAIVTNSGTGVWSGVQVQAKFFDADNRLVTTESAYIGDLHPGANAAGGSLWQPPATPTRMDVVIFDGGSLFEETAAGALTIDQLAITNPDSSSATVTGNVTSTFTEEESFVELVLVWRDAANAVVFSASTYTDTVPANGSATFEADLYGDNLPTTPPNEVYWSV